MFRRIKINLIQKPMTTLVLFLTFTIIIAFVFFCISMLRSYNILYEEMKADFGSSVSIGMKTDKSMTYEEQLELFEENYNPLENIGEITYENIDEILEIEGVLGVSSHVSATITPINFENVKEYTGEDPYEQSYEAMEKTGLSEEEIVKQGEEVFLSGEIDIKMVESFRLGWNELIDGDFPGRGKSEVIISDELANFNNLEIGDTLEFKYAEAPNRDTYKFKVSGIYSTQMYFEVLEENERRGSYIIRGSPYNGIYTDWEDVNSIAKLYDGLKMLDVYFDTSRDVDVIIKELENTTVNWNEFEAKYYLGEYELIEQGLVNFHDSILGILFLSAVGGVVLFLIILLSFDDNKEIAVLICIGEKRKNAVKKKTLEYLVISLLALPFAVLVGYVAVILLSTPLNPKDAQVEGVLVVSTLDTGRMALRPKLTANFNIIDVLLVAVYALVLVAFSYVINKLKVKKHNTKKFIMGEEE